MRTLQVQNPYWKKPNRTDLRTWGSCLQDTGQWMGQHRALRQPVSVALISLLLPLLRACVICHFVRKLALLLFLKGESHIFPGTYLRISYLTPACSLFLGVCEHLNYDASPLNHRFLTCKARHLNMMIQGPFSSGWQGSPSLHLRNELYYWQCLIVLQMVLRDCSPLTLLSLNYDLSKPLEEKCLLFWEFILHLLIWGKIEYFKQCSIAAVARKGDWPQRLPGDKAIRKPQSPCLTSFSLPSFLPLSFPCSLFIFCFKDIKINLLLC